MVLWSDLRTLQVVASITLKWSSENLTSVIIMSGLGHDLAQIHIDFYKSV